MKKTQNIQDKNIESTDHTIRRPNIESENEAEFEAGLDSEDPKQESTRVLNSNVELEKLKKELEESNNKFLYSAAELENTRKRHLKEKSELLKYAGENLARDLLEVLDDLERMVGSATEEGAQVQVETLLEGLTLVSNRMKSLFERFQIKGHGSTGEPFDPNKHEALTVVPTSEFEVGTVIKEIKKAYFYKDKLLRPAQVIVAGEQNLESEDTEDKN